MADHRYAALRERNFLLFTIGGLIANIGRQMLTVAIGWEIYEKTHSPLALGYIGLAQFLPVLLLTLPAGQAVDHFDRRKVLIFSQVIGAMATAGLFWMSFTAGPVWSMYAFLVLAGISRAFNSPANSAIVPQIVSEENFTNAVTWSSMTWQTAAVMGPALGGLMIGTLHHAWPVYLVETVTGLMFLILLLFIRNKRQINPHRGVSWRSLVSGIEFVWNTKMILAAITLDMFAVLFGGAVALMPVYAKDILHVGPSGLGWLQAAPSIGAIAVGYFIAKIREFRNAGPLLMSCVIGFGLATIIFGLSKWFWLSFLMMLLAGGLDNVSVVIRNALVQLRTPDEMRGRVSAINFVFIGTSNELGGFESGVVANWFGPVFSVVFGGIATILTVILVSLKWPDLRHMDRIKEEPAGQA